MVFLDYYAAPQAAYYAIPNREIFRGNVYHIFASLQNDPYALIFGTSPFTLQR